MSRIILFFGLGNPGADFYGTRHNIGSAILDVLAERYRLGWREVAGPVMEACWDRGEGAVTLLKSLTYMNDSGKAITGYGVVDPRSLLVICDDINLAFGALRFREGGGSGGHRGLESIIYHLASADFPRLRIGIGAPPPGTEWSEYVLEPFSLEETKWVRKLLDSAADALETVVCKGLPAAMQQYNRTRIDTEDSGE